MDATAIDAPDDSYDLVVFAASFHHLPPATACKAIFEATRVGQRFLVIDPERPSTKGLVVAQILALPMVAGPRLVYAPGAARRIHHRLARLRQIGFHGTGSCRRPRMRIEFLPRPVRFEPPSIMVLFSRPDVTPNPKRSLQ
ncbi:class I SAM-dependent methyltransferase [Nocardia vinacea]